MGLCLRYMHSDDIPQVVMLDALSFPDPWTARSYHFEVNESKVSHMVVLEDASAPANLLPQPPRSLWDRLLRRNLPLPVTPVGARIVSYGGLWHIVEESHISTIATLPDERGKGYGEIVLAGMLEKAMSLDAEYTVLEVRVSNHAAQNLYIKYGFLVEDTKTRYYRDGEDAYDMRLDLRNPRTRALLTSNTEQLSVLVAYTDAFSTATHPRFG